MKIGIDISQIVYEGTGVGTYVRRMVENLLNIDTQNKYVLFGSSFRKKYVFDEYENDERLNAALYHVLTKRCENMPIRQMIVMEISRRRKELFAYKNIPNCPNNTNLIELFNSHFNARLKSLKGFKTKKHAQ